MNKIEKNLSANELQDFLKLCLDTKDLTLARIQSLAADWGIQISLMSAKSFRDGTFESQLKKINQVQELSLKVAGIVQAGAGTDVADAAAAIISHEVFEELGKSIDDEGRIDLDTASKIIARMRLGDQRGKYLEAKLKEYEAKEEERAEKKAQIRKTITAAKKTSGGLSKQTLEQIEMEVGLL